MIDMFLSHLIYENILVYNEKDSLYISIMSHTLTV